jgi:twitching motility protein PilI
MAAPRIDPLALLQQMQEHSRHTAPGLPEQVQAAPLWSGLGFRVANLQLVTPLDHVSEVLPCPPVTLVPGTKHWLKGIANVRGTLVTIIDLPEFFGKEPVRLDDRSRLLILNIPGLSTALLVNEVVGLRHFDEEQEKRDITGLDDPALVHVSGGFLRENVLWGVFDMGSLAESEAFRHVAV